MILTCPFCQARFLIAASLFDANPRQMRCARCHHSWIAEMSASGEALPVMPVAPLFDNSTKAPPKPGRRIFRNLPRMNMDFLPELSPSVATYARRAGAAALVMAGLLLLGDVILNRQSIAQHWPSLERYYRDIGLRIYHPGDGLAIEDVHSEVQYDDGIMKLVVEGQIYNMSAELQQIPPLLVVPIAADGQAMQGWQIDAPAATLPAGGKVPFRSAINVPKGMVVDINLRFVEPAHVTH